MRLFWGLILPMCFLVRLAAAILLLALSAANAQGDVLEVIPDDDLDIMFSKLAPGTVVQFTPGKYYFVPKNFRDPRCGNCESESTQVQATVGLRVSGQQIWMLGPPDGNAELITSSGYGIYFDDCRGCTIEGLIITGGQRDPDPMASDGAIVAHNSSVTVSNCAIRENIGDSTRVVNGIVGIAGIVGREGSVLTIKNNRILRNSWDGIVLYRKAQATIENNYIDGIDLARASEAGGGRGVGIGVTWDAYASIRGNVIRHYWKGIGAFVDAQVTVEENIVEHVATWGMTLWDAGDGRPTGRFRRNAIFDTGACGVSLVRKLDSPPPGHLVQNVFVSTGQDPRYDSGTPYCEQTAIARSEVTNNFGIGSNIAYSNREPGGQRGREDVDARDFRTRIQPILKALDQWPVLKDTDFWREYGFKPAKPEADLTDTLGIAPAKPDSARGAPAKPDSTQPAPAKLDSASVDSSGS